MFMHIFCYYLKVPEYSKLSPHYFKSSIEFFCLFVLLLCVCLLSVYICLYTHRTCVHMFMHTSMLAYPSLHLNGLVVKASGYRVQIQAESYP